MISPFAQTARGPRLRRTGLLGRHLHWHQATVLAVLLFLAVVTAACTSSEDATPQVVPTPTAQTPTTPTPTTPTPTMVPEAAADPAAEPSPTPAPTSTPSSRLVVQHNTELFTITAAGEGRVDLTENDGTSNTQPTWSPDGAQIAWTNFNPATGEAFVRSDRFDLSDRKETLMETPPFYLGWDDGSAQVAFLAPSAGGIDFGLVQIGDEAAVRLDRGEPFWFSWGPLGDELLVHVSGFRLDRIDVKDATLVIVDASPAPFQAPAWVGAESLMVYANEIDGDNFLVTSGVAGENLRPLATFDGYLTMSVSPDGARIAFQTVSLTPEPGITTASFPDSVAQAIPTPDPDDPFGDPIDEIAINTLNVIGTFGGEATPLTFQEARGFFWSPDSSRLAFLTDGMTPGSMQWWFWQDGTRVPPSRGPEFIPSSVFEQNYLPFFDQYEQSVEYWSPDNDRVVYAGTDTVTGETGIWTVGIEVGAQPQFVSEGDFAAWSPTDAGSASASAL